MAYDEFGLLDSCEDPKQENQVHPLQLGIASLDLANAIVYKL